MRFILAPFRPIRPIPLYLILSRPILFHYLLSPSSQLVFISRAKPNKVELVSSKSKLHPVIFSQLIPPIKMR